MSQSATPGATDRKDKSTTTKRVSILALAAPFLSLALSVCFAPDQFGANDRFRNGLHGVLGAPDHEYDFQHASAMLFAIPATILIVRAYFAPATSQVIALAIGGFAASIIIASCFFGRTDACSMLLLGAISLGLLAYGFQPRSKVKRRSS